MVRIAFQVFDSGGYFPLILLHEILVIIGDI